MSTLTSLTINGTERKALVLKETVRLSDELNARDTLEFTMRDAAGTARPSVGQVVVLTLDGVVRFAGTIDNFTERNLTPNVASQREYRVQVVDYNQLADRHLVAEIYTLQTMKQIVQDIVTDHLAADGVTVHGSFPTGPTIDHIAFNYMEASRCFDELSELTGYFWIIDSSKVLNFIDRTTMAAPGSSTDASDTDLAGSFKVERTRERYRNQQWIRGGLTQSSTLTEEEKGDGVKTVFMTSLPVAQIPVVKVNGSAKTVGIRQVDTGKDWYWQENSNEISQDTAGVKLTTSDTWRIEYVGYFPFLTAARDPIAVADRIAVEGGSGLYEAIEDHDEITKAELGRDKAEGLLKRFGRIETHVSFTSRLAGWKAGQLVSVSRTVHNLSGTFLVMSMSLRHIGLEEYHVDVEAVAGDAVESWVAFFAALMDAGRRIVRRPNEVISLVRFYPEPLTIAESFAAPTSTSAADGQVREVGQSQTERHKVGFARVG